MEATILYQETQRIRQWWLWLFLCSLDGLMVVALIKQFIFNQPFGQNPLSNTGLVFLTLFITLFTLFFVIMKLETIISQDGIYVRFFPFHRHFKHYPWSSLCNVYVRSYAPLADYGGWGIKFGPGGKAYNVSGKTGVQLEFKDKSKLLIGTAKPQQLKAALEQSPFKS